MIIQVLLFSEHKRSSAMTKITLTFLLILFSMVFFVACPHNPSLNIVPGVDLKRYTGIWYEIASYPTSFQKGCIGTKATYSLRDDGDIDVLNQCYKKGFDADIASAKGKAWVVDKSTNAKLKVRFFWPFWGSYWIIDLGKNYDYAVVGHPSRKYLWVLSRTPQMDDVLYYDILGRITQQGYDTSKLVKTIQK
jgi:apolipoprotein D and lipocalin family protein